MDEVLFRQLKESKYYHPVPTEVMFNQNMMLEMDTNIVDGPDAIVAVNANRNPNNVSTVKRL